MGEKLLSRKFWLAFLSCVYFAFVSAHAQIAQVVIAYLAVQAGAEAFASYTEARSSGES